MILSRVANHLFWCGRYLERIENVSRFLQVQYFIGLEAHGVEDFKFTLSSIMNMTGHEHTENDLEEEIVLDKVMYDKYSSQSIVYYSEMLCHNIKNIRESLSIQLYRSVNELYFFISNFDKDYYKTRGLYELTQGIIERCNSIKSHINNTLLNNEAWALIRVGSHIERAIQVNGMLLTKFYDIENLKNHLDYQNILPIQLISILDSVEATDMCKLVFSKTPNQEIVLRFILLEKDFNKSIIHNLLQIKTFIQKIFPESLLNNNKLFFKINKLVDTFPYIDMSAIKKNPIVFLNQNLLDLNNLASEIEKKHLSY